jgi:L-seryl-tRNA(Ser) seleniumtransferase
VPFRASAGTAQPAAEDYYAKLGVQRIINAAGTYTYLTAAVMPPSVRRAVEQAAYHPVRLKELQKASGEYLARKLRCEAALVSSGASAALTLATAACIAKANGLPPEAIPGGVAGHKNEVVVQKFGATGRSNSRGNGYRRSHQIRSYGGACSYCPCGKHTTDGSS